MERESASRGILYALGGGTTFGAILTTVEAYDPATDSWTGKAPMLTPRHSLGVTAINGTLYAVGGATIGTLVPAPVEAYDPSTDTWTAKASMPTPRSHLGVAQSAASCTRWVA